MAKAQKLKEVSGTKPEENAAPNAAPVSQDAKLQTSGGSPRGRLFSNIWAREFPVQGKQKTFYSVTLERSYKDRDGAWKYTKSFDADSLGKVVSLCQQASVTINGLQQQEAANSVSVLRGAGS